MPTTKDYLEKRAVAWHEVSEIIERAATEGRELTAEENQTIERGFADIDRLAESADHLQRFDLLGQADYGDADPRLPDLRGVVNGGSGLDPKVEKEAQHRAAFDKFLRYGASSLSAEERSYISEVDAGGAQFRAQGTNIGSAGGFTVPQGFWAKVTEVMKWYATVADVATVLDTDMGNDIPWPSNDDTSNTGGLLGENVQETNLDLTFGQRKLSAWMYTSRIIQISIQLMQDAGVDVESFVAKKAGQRLGRIVNQHFTTGTGAGQPQGFITGATLGKTTASPTAITYGEVIDLLHSVDVAYRQGAIFCFHDLVLAYLRKMVDSQSRPLWQPSIANGVPDTFAGYGYQVNNFMDSTVTAVKNVMAFGNFQEGYVVRQVRQPQMLRLDERYADYLQVGFLLFARYDGMVQDTNAIKIMTTHS